MIALIVNQPVVYGIFHTYDISSGTPVLVGSTERLLPLALVKMYVDQYAFSPEHNLTVEECVKEAIFDEMQPRLQEIEKECSNEQFETKCFHWIVLPDSGSHLMHCAFGMFYDMFYHFRAMLRRMADTSNPYHQCLPYFD